MTKAMAAGPWRTGGRGRLEVARRLAWKVRHDNISLLSARVAFYAMLSRCSWGRI